MPIRAFEIRTAALLFGANVPATAPFIRYQWSRAPQGSCNVFDKVSVLLYRAQAIGDGQVGSLEIAQKPIDVVAVVQGGLLGWKENM